MAGRLLALLIGAAMAALALYLRDPALYGPETPGVSLGGYETFRPLLIFCVGGLALCGLMAAVGPGDRAKKKRGAHEAAAPVVLAGPVEDAAPMTQETTFEPDPDAFRLGSSPSARPLW